MSRGSTVLSVDVPHNPGASVAVEVRIAWVRCEVCGDCAAEMSDDE